MTLGKLYDKMKVEEIFVSVKGYKGFEEMFKIKVELFVLNHDWLL